MQKQNFSKNVQNKYKEIIMERLTHNRKKEQKKSDSRIHSLKTQCTPNDKTQDVHQKMFEHFENNFKLRYKPIILKQRPKPVGRCLYPQLIQLSKKHSLNTSVSYEKVRKTRANTQISTTNQQNKKHSIQLGKKQFKHMKQEKDFKLKKKTLQVDICANQGHHSMKRNRSEVLLKADSQPSTLQRVQSKKELKQVKLKKNESMGKNLNSCEVYSIKSFKSLSRKCINKNM